jgi:hypothetical protein
MGGHLKDSRKSSGFHTISPLHARAGKVSSGAMKTSFRRAG